MSSEEFLTCSLSPVQQQGVNETAGSPSSSSNTSSAVLLSPDGKWKTSSFYLDTSSGRSSILLPLQLQFRSKEVRDQFFQANCFQPPPPPVTTTGSPGVTVDDAISPTIKLGQTTTTTIDPNIIVVRKVIGIEAKVTLTFGTGSARTATVEGITILSTKLGCIPYVDTDSVYFQTEIIVRVTRSNVDHDDNDEENDKNNDHLSHSDRQQQQRHRNYNDSNNNDAPKVKTNLEINAVFTEVTKIRRSTGGNTGVGAVEVLRPYPLQGGQYGGTNPLTAASSYSRQITETKLPSPLALYVELTHALSLSVKSIPGPRPGLTFLSFTMAHSNTHHQPVTVTSISLHPSNSTCTQPVGVVVDTVTAHNNTELSSRSNTEVSGSTQLLARSSTVVDMSKPVKWAFAPRSSPPIPLTLNRNEAFSTILTVDASVDTTSRSFTCPLSITATVGHEGPNRHDNVVAAVQASWSTSPTTLSPADSFRVEMSLPNDDKATPTVVGEPLTVLLDVYNLSTESRQLMLLLDQTTSSSPSLNSSGSGSSSNTSTESTAMTLQRKVVVSEQGGYKFGVWGLSASPNRNLVYRDTPENEHDKNNVNQFVAIDVALLLGEIKGQSSMKAKLRMIPLREGILRIPNFHFIDNRTGKKYTCCHRFHASISASTSTASPPTI